MKQRGFTNNGRGGGRSQGMNRPNRTAKPARIVSKEQGNAKNSKLPVGTTVTLSVAKMTEYGYFLTDGETNILLHNNEATRTLSQGEQVEVFLYTDHDGRVAATMEEPIVQVGEFGWLEVVEIITRMGVFLNNGIKRDVLLFVDDLPMLRNEWPRLGDMILVSLKRDKEGRLLAQPVSEEVIAPNAKPGTPDMLNKVLDGTVYKIIGAGAFLLTEGEHVLFIHRDEMTEPLRLGQTVQARISYVREDGKMNGSMKARKEQLYSEDADKLMRYLENRGGSMPYTDDSAPEVIRDVFGMSKSAFKRALGKLLKERRITSAEGWTRIAASNEADKS
ncbi:CvfB family protein [Brevibacillus fluminis]|nr:S1-like domain-containing RNA-binding protein [Brevibacillus fluminis]